jgi:cytochrome c
MDNHINQTQRHKDTEDWLSSLCLRRRSVLWHGGSVFALLCLLFLQNACQSPPNEPSTLVRRSILDGQTRMLTIQLQDDLYAAYDLENCQLYKLWQGGVHWEGANFTDVKTVQPSTWGHSFYENPRGPRQSRWEVMQNGAKKEVEAFLDSYFISKEGTRLVYYLAWGGAKPIKVIEDPRLWDEGKYWQFTRFMLLQDVPEGIRVLLNDEELKVDSLISLGIACKKTQTPTRPQAVALGNNPSLYWLDRSGCTLCHAEKERKIGPSWQEIAGTYSDEPREVKELVKTVQEGSAGKWGQAAMTPHPHIEKKDLERMIRYILSLAPREKEPRPARPRVAQEEKQQTPPPGFGAPLTAVHPAYDLQDLRPPGFEPRVGGMDFLPDGRLLVCTWDSVGAVYALSGVEKGDPSQMEVQRIAVGLAEPLGLKTVGEAIYVMQKNELTELIDYEKDGFYDQYRVVCDEFGVTADFHEYSYGLEYQDGYFFAPLGLAMRLMKHELQHPDRGTLIKVAEDGSYERIVTGLRQPNGIGRGPEGELFLTENQGQWVPASKLIHVRQGDFHGCQFGTGDRYANQEMVPPAVWLPQDEIGNSPSQPVLMQDGPYAGQMIFGEVTHGGIKRAFLEKINGEYQGCVFRFTQGLEAGINRLVWGPDGALYAGGVGMVGGWSWQGRQFGLQRLQYNGKVPYEMLAVRALPDGLEIEFTREINDNTRRALENLIVQQWRYEATPAYGGPKIDLQSLSDIELRYPENPRKAQLIISGLMEGHVVYLQIPPHEHSKDDPLWSGDVWYTLNHIPAQ